jgi:hypothetical protein
MIDFLLGFLVPGPSGMPIRARLVALGLIGLILAAIVAALML